MTAYASGSSLLKAQNLLQKRQSFNCRRKLSETDSDDKNNEVELKLENEESEQNI